MKQILLLDIGGVLILSKWHEVLTDWSARLRKNIEEVYRIIRDYNSVLAHGTSLSISQYLEDGHIDWIDQQDFEKLRHDLWGSEYVNDELVAYCLKQCERYDYALLTNNFKGVEQLLEAKYHIPKFYKQIINSSEVGITKPNPLIYEHALRVLGVSPGQCVFVDDKIENVQSAIAIGMKGILYTDFSDFTQKLEALPQDS